MPKLSIPSVLVNNSAAYVIWEQPALALVAAASDGSLPVTSSAQLTYESAAGTTKNVDLMLPSSTDPSQSAQFFGVLAANTMYTVKLTVTYNVDKNDFNSAPAEEEIKTLPEGGR